MLPQFSIRISFRNSTLAFGHGLGFASAASGRSIFEKKKWDGLRG